MLKGAVKLSTLADLVQINALGFARRCKHLVNCNYGIVVSKRVLCRLNAKPASLTIRRYRTVKGVGTTIRTGHLFRKCIMPWS